MTTSVTEINKAIEIIKQFQSQLATIDADLIETVGIVEISEHMDDVICDLEQELSDLEDDDDFTDPAGGSGLYSHI
jgi:hypothetical protein